MRKRVFVLEDNEERIKLFKEKFELGNDLVIKTNADDAILYLSQDLDFDIFMLDHDLGNRAYVDCKDDNTGSRVAKFLSTQEIEEGQVILIHSLNYWGAKSMMGYLPTALYTPGIWMKGEFPNFTYDVMLERLKEKL